MSKVAVVYWSQTGNTESMAEAIADGAVAAGAEVKKFTAGEFSADLVKDYQAIAFGCPSMGDEVLEEDEFQPMWDSVSSVLDGVTVGIFGSYGWGDGEWMRNWQAECEAKNIKLVADGLIINELPDGDGVDACKAMGAALAAV